MSETAMTTAVLDPAEPDGAPRLAVLDILRGIAILGILFMNINDMGGPLAATDPRVLGWTGADQVAWWLREVMAQGTARCLLEMLFGCGMVILTDRAATRMGEWQVLRAYAFRNIVLFVFGLIHLFVLLWPGEILHTYGLAALVAMLFRRAKPRLMLAVGLAGATAQLLIGGYFTASSLHQHARMAVLDARVATHAPLTPAERKELAADHKAAAERAKFRAADDKLVVKEDKARSGTALTWVDAAWQTIVELEKRLLEPFWVWEAAGTMLIGAALFRWGIIQGLRSRRFYVGLMLSGYLAGLGLRGWEAYVVTRFAHLPSFAFPASEYARLATTLGHVALVNLLLRSAAGTKLLRPFSAAGRTALTVYVAQTMVCVWVLYPPWGLRLYRQQGWASLMLTAAAVDIALLVLANAWVRRFSIAPVEWAWRSVLAGRALPFGYRGARVGAPVLA